MRSSQSRPLLDGEQGQRIETRLDVEVLLDESRGNGRVDVLDSLGDTLATPLGLVAVPVILLLLLFPRHALSRVW